MAKHGHSDATIMESETVSLASDPRVRHWCTNESPTSRGVSCTIITRQLFPVPGFTRQCLAGSRAPHGRPCT